MDLSEFDNMNYIFDDIIELFDNSVWDKLDYTLWDICNLFIEEMVNFQVNVKSTIRRLY